MVNSQTKQFTEFTDQAPDDFSKTFNIDVVRVLRGQYEIKTMLSDKFLGNDGRNHQEELWVF